MRRAVITHAFRTPIGKFLGQWSDLSAVELGTSIASGLLAKAGVPAADVGLTIFGCARQAGLGPNPARQVAIRSGIPETSPAWTINLACGSGLWAIVQAAQSIALGDADVVLAGGMENMTRVPFLLPQLRKGYRMGHAPVVDAMYQDGFNCPLADQPMGATADTLARQYTLSRDEQDAYACRSHNRYEAAQTRGAFADEVLPLTVKSKAGPVSVTADEHPRAGASIADFAKLPPHFDPKAGFVTAGNASGIADGAAAVLVMSEEAARARGLEPLAVIEGHAISGVDPKVMGLGPVPSTRALMKRVGRELAAYDLVELNEAFAAQVLACDRDLRIDPDRLNVNGGSIAMGHPIGCSGARIVATLLHELRRRGGKLGLATLCISGGQGIAVSFVRSW